MIIEFDLWRAGLVQKAVELRIPPPLKAELTNRDEGKIVHYRAHYYERETTIIGANLDDHCGQEDNDGNHTRQKDLLIIPGFSMDASNMSILIRTLDLPPAFRIVVMELPLHNKT